MIFFDWLIHLWREHNKFCLHSITIHYSSLFISILNKTDQNIRYNDCSVYYIYSKFKSGWASVYIRHTVVAYFFFGGLPRGGIKTSFAYILLQYIVPPLFFSILNFSD